MNSTSLVYVISILENQITLYYKWFYQNILTIAKPANLRYLLHWMFHRGAGFYVCLFVIFIGSILCNILVLTFNN